MKGFKTYVITKKTLIKIALLLLSCIIAVIIISVLFFNAKKDIAVTAFSDDAKRILDEGVISDKKTNTVKETVQDIIGFDAENPVSIISSSSSALKNTNSRENAPKATSEPEIIKDYSKELPTHNEIINASDLKMSNATNYDVDINSLCKEPLDIKLNMKDIEVLIIHTHTTECYSGNEMTGESERTTNEKYNMCRIGEIVSETLNSYGIKTIHDKTIHDYPTYQGSYTRALKTIEKNIKENPEIKVVIDIHRDAYVYSDGSKLRVATDDGAAKAMLVLGTDSMGLEHPFWKSNLTLAAKIQNSAEIMYPELMRPINLRRERFNMHMSRGSILIEIGSNGNSLGEAEKSAVYIGNAIAAALING